MSWINRDEAFIEETQRNHWLTQYSKSKDYSIKWLIRTIMMLLVLVCALSCLIWYQAEKIDLLLQELKTATVIPVKTWEEVTRGLR